MPPALDVGMLLEDAKATTFYTIVCFVLFCFILFCFILFLFLFYFVLFYFVFVFVFVLFCFVLFFHISHNSDRPWFGRCALRRPG